MIRPRNAAYTKGFNDYLAGAGLGKQANRLGDAFGAVFGGEGEGPISKESFGALLAASAGTSLASKAWQNHGMDLLTRQKLSDEGIAELARKVGFDPAKIYNGVDGPLASTVRPLIEQLNTQPWLARTLVKLMPQIAQMQGMVNPRNAFYSPRVDESMFRSRGMAVPSGFTPIDEHIQMGAGFKGREGILAHELGHYTRGTGLAQLGRQLHGVGSMSALLPAIMKDDDNASMAAAAGSAFSLPMVADESLASWAGSKALRGNGFMRRLAPFAGVPTYALAASLPWGVYGAKKLFGGYTADPVAERAAETAAGAGGWPWQTGS
jgi:hypothetical protein